MQNKILTLTALLLALCLSRASEAAITLPPILSDHMVLQRNTTTKIWGWAGQGAQVSVEASWLASPVSGEADKNGYWQVALPTTDANGPQSLKISDSGETVTLGNVLLGEVWLCSGQSNMYFPLRGSRGEPVAKGLSAIALARNDQLRLFSVKRQAKTTPSAKAHPDNGTWQASTPKTAASFSAVAYFFGSQLQQALGVPVGLVHASWGGSPIEAWMSEKALAPFGNTIPKKLAERPHKTPTALYNGMIHPILGYAVKGALWYQGESNRNEPDTYTQFLPAMVKDWRARWGHDFPFCYAQIAPYAYPPHRDAYSKPKNTAFFREAQQKCLSLVPDAYMAATMDTGAQWSIHPPQKKPVADRLLYIALHHAYGHKTVDYSGPVYKEMAIKDGGIRLTFDHAENGLYALGEAQIPGFEIAGADRVFYPAKAKIVDRGAAVFVSSSQVPEPKAARYAWQNWVYGTLYDASMLPAPSFRTDDWDNATQKQ